MKRFLKRSAFTIVEMVIVIAVIGILATVMVPTISGMIERANKSADTQFAASLTIQLAMESVDGGIRNESDLRDAVNKYYGTEEEPDYYNKKLVPKAAKSGNYFWYHYDSGTVFAATVEDAPTEAAKLPSSPSMDASGGGASRSFSPASLRSDLIPGLYLMGCKPDGATGGELVDIISQFENVGVDGANPQQYEDAVLALKEMAAESDSAQTLLDKVAVTTIVTGTGAYRFGDVNAIEHVYVPLSTTIINVQDVFTFDGAEVDDGEDPIDCPLATAAKVPVVQIPVGVKIASNGFPAMSECTDPSAEGDYQNATVLEILTNNMADLTDAEGNFMFDVHTSYPVFKLQGSGLYFMDEDQVYNLPYTEGDTSVEVGGTVGTGTSQNLNVEVSFPNASVNPGEGSHFYDSVNKILYVQYDQSEVAITVKNGKYVAWNYELVTSKDDKSTDLITVSGNVITVNRKLEPGENNQIMVSGSINGTEKVSFTVCLVMPRDVQVGDYNSTTDGVGVENARPIKLTYNDTVNFPLNFAVNYGANNKVAPWTVTVASKNGKFTPVLNDAKDQLTITLGAEHAFEDVLMVTVGETTFEFTVVVEDNSGAAFDKALFGNSDTVKIGDNYLFRVGNKNAIKLNYLFSTTQAYNEVGVKFYDCSTGTAIEIGGETPVSQTVTVTGAEKAADGVLWTFNRAKWDEKSVSVKFGKVGVVKIEIGSVKNGVFDPDTDLLLEVVDGTNVFTYSELKGSGNRVLWADITMSEGDTYSLSNSTLFGNGYTFDVSKGAYEATKDGYATQAYVINLSNAIIDNTQIIGDVYTTAPITVKYDYCRAIVLASGNSGIYNSYISNGMSPVRVLNGNVVIENTTLKGGVYANLDINGGNVTLKNITTINQVNVNDKSSDNKTIVGLGIVVWYDGTPAETTLNIEGTLTQYNYLSKSEADSYIKGDLGERLVSEIYNNSGLSNFRYNDGKTVWINTGIVSMTDNVGKNNLLVNGVIDDPSGYTSKVVEMNVPVIGDVTGYAWTLPADTVKNNYTSVPGEWQPSAQNPIAPSYSFDYTNKNYDSKADEKDNDYCYYDNTQGIVMIGMDAGDTFNWDPSILTATKNGKTLSYKVSMNGTDYTGKKIPFNTEGTYVVTYTYVDANNYNVSGASYDVTYTKTVKIHVAVKAAEAKNATFDFNGNGYKTVKIGDKIYVMPNVTGTSTNVGSTTVSGTTVYAPIVQGYTSNGKTSQTSGTSWYMYFPVFKGAVTITDYANKGLGDAVVYDGSTTTLPAGLAAVNPASSFQYNSKATAPTTPTTASSVLVYTSPEMEGVSRDALTINVQYTYTDNAGSTYYYYVQYKTPKITNTACVTGDTLVTLADGTQKEIQYVTESDLLMVWNHFTGKYDVVPAAIIFNHGYDNNTVIKLNFSDGTQVKMINIHQFLDVDLNKYVSINAANVADYVGHNFAKKDGEGYTTVTLESYEISEEYIEAYGIISALHYNILVEGMFSTDFMSQDYDLFNYFTIGDGLVYDAEQMQKDIEKYGLYTYEDFADYLTYEQFVGFNVQYFKIAVGKGVYTYEGILNLINAYLNA